MSEFRKVVTKPGEIIDYETVFEENPYLRTGVPTKKGTVERIDYTTSVYEGGKTYNKTCYVYLPYGYDKDDKSRKYNVLYFQHGNTCEPAMFAIGGNKPMFDMLFESGEIEPCIIVFITYYFDPMGDADDRIQTGMAPAGDGEWPLVKGRYYKEVVENIIPEVEMRYNTYLTEATDEGIRATRDHRAFSGYSRGCVMTWRMVNHAMEYFRWFAPMSGSVRGDFARGTVFSEQQVIDYLTEPMREGLPFYIYACCGGIEDGAEMKTQLKWITGNPAFSYGKDPSRNNICVSLSDYYHTDYLVPYYFWNSLKVIFREA